MTTDQTAVGQSLLRNLPSVDSLMRDEDVKALHSLIGSNELTEIARELVVELRAAILDRPDDAGGFAAADLFAEAKRRLLNAANLRGRQGTLRVINATGVVIHTNLGRAPLSS